MPHLCNDYDFKIAHNFDKIKWAVLCTLNVVRLVHHKEGEMFGVTAFLFESEMQLMLEFV